MILIFAGNFRQARDWGKRNIEIPAGMTLNQVCRYIDRPEKLHGVRRHLVGVVTGTFWMDNPHAADLMDIARVKGVVFLRG